MSSMCRHLKRVAVAVPVSLWQSPQIGVKHSSRIAKRPLCHLASVTRGAPEYGVAQYGAFWNPMVS